MDNVKTCDKGVRKTIGDITSAKVEKPQQQQLKQQLRKVSRSANDYTRFGEDLRFFQNWRNPG